MKRLDAPSRLRDFVITLKTLREPVGVSNDDVAAHCGFRDHHGLNFRLLCDVDRTLSNDCGLMSEQVKDGKSRIRINRSTLLIDENGRFLKVMKGVAAREHVAELLQMLCSK